MKSALEESELQLVKKFLVNRILKIREAQLASQNRDSSKYGSNASLSLVKHTDLYDQLDKGVKIGFSSSELEIIHGCINENLESLRKVSQETGKTLNTSENNSSATLDMCMNILTKTGFVSNEDSTINTSDSPAEKSPDIFDLIKSSTKRFYNSVL